MLGSDVSVPITDLGQLREEVLSDSYFLVIINGLPVAHQ